jgi:hypothetical protein
MDLLKFELRSFVAGAGLVGALWAFGHACAVERAPDTPPLPFDAIDVDAARERLAPAKVERDAGDVLEE